MGVSKNRGGPPKSSILIGFSIINHPFWGAPIFGNTHIKINSGNKILVTLQYTGWFIGDLLRLTPTKTNMTMKNHCLQQEIHLQIVVFSIVMLVFWRVTIFKSYSRIQRPNFLVHFRTPDAPNLGGKSPPRSISLNPGWLVREPYNGLVSSP